MCRAAVLKLLAEAVLCARESSIHIWIACLQNVNLSSQRQWAMLERAGDLMPSLHVIPSVMCASDQISAGTCGPLQNVL